MKKSGLSKIYIVSPTESPITKRGKRHPNLADYLVSKDEELIYLTSTINHAEKVIFSNEEIQQCKLASKYPIHFFKCGLYKNNISLRRVLWNYVFSFKVFLFLLFNAKKNDVVIFPSRPSELLFAASVVKFFKKIKLFIDVEDVWPDAFQINNSIVRSLFHFYCNIINRVSISNFDSGVHVSPNFKNWLEKYSVKFDSKLAVLGVTKDEDKPQFKKKYSKISDLTFFYGGTLSLQFDILPFLKALKNIDLNCKVILVGDNGSGNRHDDVINFLELNSFNYLNLGHISKDNLISYLGESDIVVIPMISGGLPKKFFDAIGCYKPIFNLGRGGVYSEILNKKIGWNSTFEIKNIESVLKSITVHQIKQKIQNIELHRDSYFEKFSIKRIYAELKKLKKCNN